MRAHSSGSGDGPTGVLQRAALILDAFEGVARLNLSQIVAATGLPLSSVHRALEQMVALRWVHRHRMDYQLGMRMIELGSMAAQQNSLRRAALPSLHWLHRATGCIVHLGVLEGTDVIYLEKIGGDLAPGVRSRVGSRLRADSSTIGKALLAGAGCSRISSPDIDRVRELRVACEHEKCMKGFSCVAVPIGPMGRGEAAAVSVFGSVAKIGVDQRIRLSVQTAAAEIWRRMQVPSSDVSGRRSAR
ncbi:IclR family transcriptional regulator [Rhodococcus wratislaviensis]|uniref:Putative IclR family transcriptional regulator n=1 Tax=Rhodococcus wratislaviensis NBRC 100605 TaxID=1219028 RepID=X0PX60_RHOWR|nr:helix-turn-helix domain-containing protein [Rhodococcus wratislaviensis]GAF42902.1 putative IclR family transcriptional regulator [Rhodococcus wratislaviensis NBRC 100605]